MLDRLRKRAEELYNISDNKTVYELIRNILSDEECFFKINSDDAYHILSDLKVKDDKIKKVYMALLNHKEIKGEIYYE